MPPPVIQGTIILAVALLVIPASASCPTLSPRPTPPSTVYDLRIDDFEVVMAMGDSMTAGFNSVKPSMHEYRGASFSIGADEGAVTLPNFIAAVKGRPLVGGSHGELAKPTVKAPCSGADVDRVCRLSAAVDGSDVQDLIDMQVGYLRDHLDNAPWAVNVSRTRDWKLLSIFTGLDDVVFYNTTNPNKTSTPAALFEANVNKLLTAIHTELPRTYVNMIMLPEEFNPSVTTSRIPCKLFKWYSELMGIHWTTTTGWLQTIRSFNQILVKVASQWRLKRLGDFSVSLQPFNRHTNLTKEDFDTADCFHPNLKAHQGMAVGLWNNMLAQTEQDKKTSWSSTDVPQCPTESSRLAA